MFTSKLFSATFQISGQTVGEVRTVVDMHERKAVMAKESDAFIALPGNDLCCSHQFSQWTISRYNFIPEKQK